ncbi:MMPL family transporter [Nocardia cyriacigeorgica]|uniref:MMPL family transporter n=1 Tax=Nocardia cyriacigeorgica TaxID=135487 RepID=UPI0018951F75|nr:MMPL family transporter [Nocardia cyriacigeorgica]MBF6089992.1 MMPL family transporter [Nocardia cyriacigeorgica]MBF6096071.1 MMPL family transporter [Nocardia cyriacigeorgica]MBF6399550.1 MMPL family transporter [Nocardia cyriacigeorgica]MBF6405180.1 MMPL family transporter [Nocardia cyriacigeorgica]MBF6499572.1 MMPL family transporter [Nocardia cyriacigeorgica]
MRAWARLVIARPRTVLAVVIGLMLLCAAYGASASDKVGAAGFTDPGSESSRVDALVREQVGPTSADVVAVYTAPDGQRLDEIGPQITAAIERIDPALLARPVESYWNSTPPRTQFLRSADGRQGLAVVFLAGDDNQRITAFESVEADLLVPGIHTELAGFSALADEITTRSQQDLILAESISIPITLLILVLVFGGLAAASMPVLVGALAVGGSLAAIRALTEFTEVTTFAVNIASLIGLGMAIDYGLFLVTRFREERAGGLDVPAAIERTCATAGRTVAFSASLLICAFAGTFVFPQPVLKSLGFGAIAAVALAAALSLTVLPAMLALFGTRLGASRGRGRTERFWGRVVDAVLRRPGIVALAVTAVLLVLATPLLGARLGDIDHRALPPDNPMRTTVEELTDRFPAANSGVTAVLHGVDGAPPPAETVAQVIREIGAVPGAGPVFQAGRATDFVVVHAMLDSADRSDDAIAVVEAVRALAPPAGTELRVGGDTAATMDSVDSITAALPWMIAVMVVATLLLLGIAFRSIVLPIKAVAMAFVSLAATFGILTWIFHDGHLAGVLGVTPGPLAAGMVVLIIAVVFGLSTDYEVFLLSRMVESHHAGAGTAESVRTGTLRTARVITAAAVLLIIVTGAFTLSPLTPMRFLGLGMIIALIIDATLVRMLLVPALVQLMGPVNWWMPGVGRPGQKEAAPSSPAREPMSSSTGNG